MRFTISIFLSTIILMAVICADILFADSQKSVGDNLEEYVKKIERIRKNHTAEASSFVDSSGKCGLRLSFDLIPYWNLLTESQKERLKTSLAPDSTQKNRIIGRFHIFYDTSGFNAPTVLDSNYQPIIGTAEEFVDSVGKYFNEVWAIQIDSLKYDAPPLEGDQKYRIQILDFGFGLYGQTILSTNPISQGPPPRYGSYIEIDNDFRDVYSSSRGMPGLKVTAAHEFHHAIQLGSYGFWSNDLYFYEITSTWMEDVVYDDVNDYYQYLSNNPSRRSHFSMPDVRFTMSNGSIEYSRAIWGKFIEQQYSSTVMRNVWEYMSEMPSIQALDMALSQASSTFREAMIQFSLWNYFTSSRSDSSKYYKEGKDYPPIRHRDTTYYVPPQGSFSDSLQLISAVYRPVILQIVTDGHPRYDTLMSIVSNIDLSNPTSNEYAKFTYRLQSTPDPSFIPLSEGIYTQLTVQEPTHWKSIELVNREFIFSPLSSEVVVYPNPYRAEAGKQLTFALPFKEETIASITIFTLSLKKMFSSDLKSIASLGQNIIRWNGLGDDNDVLPSGLYLFVINAQDQKYLGKFSVIRN
ncbi:MAG TPA: T9SS type A sorting domain-containing protein [Bacteroidota bacterium]|nr:T9SS type A sorting domain-containing protein [Bacteroidota bacterium]